MKEETHLCRRCGRKLRSAASKERGMGDTCFRKYLVEDCHKKLFTTLQTDKKNL